VQGDEAAVLMAPKATPEGRYEAHDSAPRREALAAAGIADGIMHRGQVERASGTPKRSCGSRRVRHRGLARNGAHLLCTAMNPRRAERRTA
jgi:IS5 family transposase